jgi:hypothetical protein
MYKTRSTCTLNSSATRFLSSLNELNCGQEVRDGNRVRSLCRCFRLIISRKQVVHDVAARTLDSSSTSIILSTCLIHLHEIVAISLFIKTKKSTHYLIQSILMWQAGQGLLGRWSRARTVEEENRRGSSKIMTRAQVILSHLTSK